MEMNLCGIYQYFYSFAQTVTKNKYYLAFVIKCMCIITKYISAFVYF